MVRAFRVGCGGNHASPGWGLGCVCLDICFGCAPLFLAAVCGACVWVWDPPAARYVWPGFRGVCPVACASSLSRQPLVGLPVASGRVVVAVGGASAPSSSFFFAVFLAAGGDLWLWFPALLCCGSVVVAASCLSLLVPWSPPPSHPFDWVCSVFTFFVSASVWPVAPNFSDGVCAGMSGVSFLPALRRPCGCVGPLLLAGCLQAGRGGPPVFYRGASWVSPLVLPGWRGRQPLVVWVWVRGFVVE